MNKKVLFILLILTVVFWGTSFAVVKVGIGDLSPVQFVFIRAVFASIIFALILIRTPKEKRKIERKDILYVAYLGFMGIAGYCAVQYTALMYTTTVNASLLIGTSPILVAIYSRFVYKEELNLWRIIGIVLCFMGIVFIITKGNFTSFSFGKTIFGDFLMIINAVMMAAFSIGGRSILKKYDPFVVVAYMNIFASIMLLPVSFIPNFLAPVSLINKIGSIDVKVILSTLYLAVTCTVLGYYSWYRGIKEIGPSRTTVFNYINPLVAAIVSFMFFDEGINMFTVLGGISIIGGVALNNMQNLLPAKVECKEQLK